MIKTLSVYNFALIEQSVVDFSEGLNILTGETGAGKSILIDALGVILGYRASVEFIRSDKDFFRVEAVFDIAEDAEVQKLLQLHEITVEDDGTLIISRRLSRSGKNTITVNGCHITLTILRTIGEHLVDMHGQHENQSLLRQESYLPLLDSFNPALKGMLHEYQTLYSYWLQIAKELNTTEKNSRERIQRLDMLKWQVEEIASADLKENEDENLEQEIKILANSEKIMSAFQHSYELLVRNGKDFNGVLNDLASVKRELENAGRYDQKAASFNEIVTDCLYQLEECAREIQDHAETIEFNPKRLSILQERMDQIYKLRKKYGPSIHDILLYYQECLKEITMISNHDDHISELLKEKKILESKLLQMAENLHQMRCQVSDELSENIQNHLVNLGMPKARFIIDVKKAAQFNGNGQNEVLFLFSANTGEEPKAVFKVASGGELSRIALAIKTVCASRDSIATLIFDEIDSGIGGQTAQMVAEKISLLSVFKQVLCITHLPQIACMADWHIHIEKKENDENTKTIVSVLNQQERLTEIARMSGGHVTSLSLKNAAEMTAVAKIKKDKWKNKAQA